MPLCIDRCVCHETLFSDLKQAATDKGVSSFKALFEAEDFGRGCGMCRPYVQKMLETGQTEYDKVLRGAKDPLIELELSKEGFLSDN